LAPPYLATKDGVKMLSFETEPFLSSGSSSFAMRVQCTSEASILTVLTPTTCSIGHWPGHR